MIPVINCHQATHEGMETFFSLAIFSLQGLLGVCDLPEIRSFGNPDPWYIAPTRVQISSLGRFQDDGAISSALGCSLARYYEYHMHDRFFVCAFATSYTTWRKMELRFPTL